MHGVHCAFEVHVKRWHVLLAFLVLGVGQSRRAVGAVPAGSDRAAACEAIGRAAGSAVRVHGRLFAANGGGSGYRIWPVGTQRLVWVSWRVQPALPDAVANRFTPFAEELYGDFTLVPLEPERAGRMREMCLLAGDNLVVRDLQSGVARRVAK